MSEAWYFDVSKVAMHIEGENEQREIKETVTDEYSMGPYRSEVRAEIERYHYAHNSHFTATNSYVKVGDCYQALTANKVKIYKPW